MLKICSTRVVYAKFFLDYFQICFIFKLYFTHFWINRPMQSVSKFPRNIFCQVNYFDRAEVYIAPHIYILPNCLILCPSWIFIKRKWLWKNGQPAQIVLDASLQKDTLSYTVVSLYSVEYGPYCLVLDHPYSMDYIPKAVGGYCFDWISDWPNGIGLVN